MLTENEIRHPETIDPDRNLRLALAMGLEGDDAE